METSFFVCFTILPSKICTVGWISFPSFPSIYFYTFFSIFFYTFSKNRQYIVHFWKVFWISFVVKQSLNVHQITPFKCKVAMFVFPVAEDVAEEGKTTIFQKATYYQPFQWRNWSCYKVFTGFPLILVSERKRDPSVLSYLLNTWNWLCCEFWSVNHFLMDQS